MTPVPCDLCKTTERVTTYALRLGLRGSPVAHLSGNLCPPCFQVVRRLLHK